MPDKEQRLRTLENKVDILVLIVWCTFIVGVVYAVAKIEEAYGDWLSNPVVFFSIGVCGLIAGLLVAWYRNRSN